METEAKSAIGIHGKRCSSPLYLDKTARNFFLKFDLCNAAHYLKQNLHWQL